MNDTAVASDHQDLGTVRGGRSNSLYRVTWYPISGEVYVSYAGGTYVGKAHSAREAANKAEAWLRNK